MLNNLTLHIAIIKVAEEQTGISMQSKYSIAS